MAPRHVGAATAAALLLCIRCVCGGAPNGQPGDVELARHFAKFRAQHARSGEEPIEEQARLRRFEATLRTVSELNERNGDAAFGVTSMADLSQQEIAAVAAKGLVMRNLSAMASLRVSSPAAPGQRRLRGGTDPAVPSFINWALTKAVTPVKSQGACGACWAFSVAQQVESMYALYIGDVQLFSPQQISSCTMESDGCGGGDPVAAYRYLIGSSGLAQSAFWPFVGPFTPDEFCDNLGCTQSCHARNLTAILRYQHLIGPYARVLTASHAIEPCWDYDSCDSQDEDGLLAALLQVGPMAAIVNAEVWTYYSGGVVTAEACGGNGMGYMNHAVQVVGFDAAAEPPYWIVRNTWTTAWGEGGYIRLAMGNNTCGIANMITYPLVEAGGRQRHRLANSESAELRLQRDRFQRFYRQAIGQERAQELSHEQPAGLQEMQHAQEVGEDEGRS